MSQQSGGAEPGFMLVMIGFIVVAAGWFIWHQFKLPILEALRWARYVELWPVYILSGGSSQHSACLDWLRHARFNDTSPSSDMVGWAQQCFGAQYMASLSAEAAYDHYRLSSLAMSDIERLITFKVRWLMAFIFGGIGGYIIFVSPLTKFRTTHTLESFIGVQAKMWPVINPIVKFNPLKYSARKPGDIMPDKIPPFAEAFTPEEWVSWHRIPMTNNIPDRESVRRAFLLQFGPRWNGIQAAPIYIQALYAAFALKGAQRREDADNLLGKLALSWSIEKGLVIPADVMAEVRKILKDPQMGGKADEIASQHAYRTPALLGVLKWARYQGGVLAPAQFTWLRAVDRTLWYPMNNLGRRSFHTEGAGAMAHFMAEQIAKKPLPVPRIDTAIITLNQYLSRPESLPIPPREGDKGPKGTAVQIRK